MRQSISLIGRIVAVSLCTIAGMIIGAVIIYMAAGFLYLITYGPGPVKDSYECARGMAWGYLSILGGGLLGAYLACAQAINFLKSFAVDSGGHN